MGNCRADLGASQEYFSDQPEKRMSQNSLEEASRCRLFLSMIQVTSGLGVGLERSIDLARRFTNEALQLAADRAKATEAATEAED